MLSHFKGHVQGQKDPILTFVEYLGNISEMVHDMTNVSMKHVYKVIYDLSVHLMTFKGQINVVDLQEVISHKWCIIGQSLYETPSKSYIPFQFTL